MCYKFQRIISSYLNFSEILRKNCEGVPIYLVKFTARKTIFSFSRRPEKMVFPKKSCWNMIFLTLLGKIMFLFLIYLTPYTENERWWSFSKKYMEIWHFLQTFWNDGLFKKGRAGTWSFLYYLERWYFFPKTWYFFLGQEVRDDPSEEIHGNMIFSVYTYGRYKRGVTPFCQKNQRWSYPAKIF